LWKNTGYTSTEIELMTGKECVYVSFAEILIEERMNFELLIERRRDRQPYI